MEKQPVQDIHVQKTFTGGDQKEHQLLYALQENMKRASSIDLCVSFLMESGARELIKDLKEAAARGVFIRILCGNYLSITQPAALFLLKDQLQNHAEIHFYDEPGRSFHPKAYIFDLDDHEEIMIGSSNLSLSALGSGIEWNYRLSSLTDPQSVKEFRESFLDLYNNHSYLLTDEKLKEYSQNWVRPGLFKDVEKASVKAPLRSASYEKNDAIVPRGPQIEALIALNKTREQGADKALIQAATGVGKTYLAAFDSQNFKRVLFVAHREEILRQAANTFHIVRSADSIGFFNQLEKNAEADLVFASVQTLGKQKYLEQYFSPEDFDYLVIDEFHHAVTDCYARITSYFKPKFLLGLTATPERMDGRNIYEICDYNVPFEIDLFKAINQGVLAPFHYYGIYDDTDYTNLEFRQGHYTAAALNKAYLANQKRYDLIFKHYRKYPSKRAIGFCSTREHAAAMAKDFDSRGVKCAALVSGMNDQYCLDRQTALKKLADSEIQVLFAVDMLNEGVDVPDLDMVMFLRPTESPVVFLQQLGRGLRKAPGKDYLNVLDFLGNYRNIARVPGFLGKPVKGTHKSPSGIPGNSAVAYPEGCLVDFDFRLIDLFEKLNQKARHIDERIKDEYFRVKDLIGNSPSRIELFTYMDDDILDYCLAHPTAGPFQDYFEFRKNLGELPDELEKLWGTPVIPFLHFLETTSMRKVQKMPVLQSFLGDGIIKSRVNGEDLVQSWNQFFRSGTNWRDVHGVSSLQEYDEISNQTHLKNIKKNPVTYLVKSGEGFFVKGKEYPISLSSILFPYLENPVMYEEMKDIIDYRTAHYYRTRYKETLKN